MPWHRGDDRRGGLGCSLQVSCCAAQGDLACCAHASRFFEGWSFPFELRKVLCGPTEHAFDVAQRAALFVSVPWRPSPPGVAVRKIQSRAQNSQKRHRQEPELQGVKHNILQSSLPCSHTQLLLEVAMRILLGKARSKKLHHLLGLESKVGWFLTTSTRRE